MRDFHTERRVKKALEFLTKEVKVRHKTTDLKSSVPRGAMADAIST
jgi:hypothetical protein